MIKNYTQKNNTFTKVTKDNPKDFIEVEVGDSKQEDFYPQTKIKRWDNECNFSVRLNDNNKKKAKVTSKDNKVTWDKGNIKIEFYEVEDAHKFVWYLKEKPKTNKVSFTIQSKGVDFFYQPELTQEEKDDGCERPENVVGSYAVYASEQKTNYVGGKEYKCGKIAHIFRPHLYDSNGLEAWGDLHIEDGIYEVTIPQEFLDNAIFPIKSNDTFGYTTEGESIATGDNQLWSDYTTMGATAGTTSSITAYLTFGWAGKVKYALYEYSNPYSLDSDLLVNTNEYSGDNDTGTLTINTQSGYSLEASTNYYLVIWRLDGNIRISFDSGGFQNYQTLAYVSGNNDFPSNITGGSAYTRKHTIYCTYTVAATDSTITGIQTIQGIQSITL